jgi:D-alanyl-D-alanine dipeptidase
MEYGLLAKPTHWSEIFKVPVRLFRGVASVKTQICNVLIALGFLLNSGMPAFAGVYHESKVLMETDRTIAGEPVRYPETFPAQTTASIVTIQPGTSTQWHRHKAPMFAYMLSGQLEVEYDGLGRKTLKAGDAFMEAMEVSHIASNLGSEPARILTVLMSGDPSAKTISVAPPGIPPVSPTATRTSELVNLAEFDPRLKFDIRYATSNNFLGYAVYPTPQAWLQRPAASALKRVHDQLRADGYGLIILDAYRPWRVTRLMWDQFPALRAYLADPLEGSRHNRGSAVDLTLFDLGTATEVSMPSGYDEFSKRAHPDYAGGSLEQRAARDKLRKAMEAEGFNVYPNEWWHYDYHDWASYPILNHPLTVEK